MFKLLHNKKNIAGFTMIELLIVISLFTLVFFAILDVTANTYRQSRKVYKQAEIYNELKTLTAQIAKKVNYASSITINPGNDGFRYALYGRSGEFFYSGSALWEKTSGVNKKLSFLKIDEVDFIAENGYMWGHIRIADKNEYFGIKLP